MRSPSIDVVIVSYNTRGDLLACLRSAVSADHRVFVVDNASTDGSIEAVRQDFPAVTLLPLDRNVGFAAANNVALAAGSAPLVLLLNSDAVLEAGAVDVLRARLDETGAAAAGPLLVDATGRPEVSFGRMLSPWTELVQLVRIRLAASGRTSARRYIARLVSTERFVDWVSGACLLVRREAGAAAGWLDERYFLYEEDVDFCAGLRGRGGRVLFTPRARVIHARGRSRAASGAGADPHYDRSHLAFYRKHRPGWAPLLRLWQTVRRRRIR